MYAQCGMLRNVREAEQNNVRRKSRHGCSSSAVKQSVRPFWLWYIAMLYFAMLHWPGVEYFPSDALAGDWISLEGSRWSATSEPFTQTTETDVHVAMNSCNTHANIYLRLLNTSLDIQDRQSAASLVL